MRRHICAIVAFVVAGTTGARLQSPATTQDETLNLSAYAELLRSDVRTLKVAILTEVMGFSEDEDAKFWPVYRECERDAAKLGDERVALIKDYAAKYASLTDDQATALASKAIELESRRNVGKAQCYEKVKAVLSPRAALRFLQVEHQLQLLIDLQIASSLPVAPPTKEIKK